MNIKQIQSTIRNASIHNTLADTDYDAIQSRLIELDRESASVMRLLCVSLGAFLLIPGSLAKLSMVIFAHPVVLPIIFGVCGAYCLKQVLFLTSFTKEVKSHFVPLSQHEKIDIINMKEHPSPDVRHYFNLFNSGGLRRPFMKLDYDVILKGIKLLEDQEIDSEFNQIIHTQET